MFPIATAPLTSSVVSPLSSLLSPPPPLLPNTSFQVHFFMPSFLFLSFSSSFSPLDFSPPLSLSSSPFSLHYFSIFFTTPSGFCCSYFVLNISHLILLRFPLPPPPPPILFPNTYSSFDLLFFLLIHFLSFSLLFSPFSNFLPPFSLFSYSTPLPTLFPFYFLLPLLLLLLHLPSFPFNDSPPPLFIYFSPPPPSSCFCAQGAKDNFFIAPALVFTRNRA
jgi:hypothetical protein